MFVLIVPLEDWFCSYPEKSWKKMFDLFISPGLESTWEAWCRRLWWILDWMGSSTRHTCRDLFINYNANTVYIVAATCMGQTACLVQYTDGTDWGCIKNGRILSILISLFLFLFWGGGALCLISESTIWTSGSKLLMLNWGICLWQSCHSIHGGTDTCTKAPCLHLPGVTIAIVD